MKQLIILFISCFLMSGCEFIQMKKESAQDNTGRKPVARVNNAFLYSDELSGIINPDVSREDSTARVEAYINSWIRKQLLILCEELAEIPHEIGIELRACAAEQFSQCPFA